MIWTTVGTKVNDDGFDLNDISMIFRHIICYNIVLHAKKTQLPSKYIISPSTTREDWYQYLFSQK